MRFLTALASCVPVVAFASSTTPDYTDLWYIPSESGWGANVVQQGPTMFVTLFVYGTNNQPTWFVASAVTQTGGSTSGAFAGALYQTTGPSFAAGSFNPSSVTVNAVGQLTFNATSSNAGTLTYTVNGVTVTKNVVRQTFGADNLTGSFLGGSMGTWSACGGGNGYVESGATFTVAQSGNNVSMREDGSNYTCTYTATSGANGRFGTLAGNGLCTDGTNFTFTASDAEVSRDAFSLRISLNRVGGTCHFDGRMGGVRKGPL